MHGKSNAHRVTRRGPDPRRRKNGLHFAECEVTHNNALINIHMTHTAAQTGGPTLLFLLRLCIPKHAAK